MAANNLLQRIQKLRDSIKNSDAVRRDLNKETTRCTVSAPEMTDTLIEAFKHYNPKKIRADKNGSLVKEKRKVFYHFSMVIVSAWKKNIKTNPKLIPAEGNSAKNVAQFYITTGSAENYFNTINKSITENVMNKPTFRKHFSIRNQEKFTATGDVASAKKEPGMKGSLQAFQMAHGEGQSVFEARQAAVEQELEAALAMENLPASASEMIATSKDNFDNNIRIGGDRQFKYNPLTGKISSKEGITVDLSVQTRRKNIKDASASMKAGKPLNKMLKELEEDLKDEIKRQDNFWGPEAKGSNSVKEGVADAIINSTIKKKMYTSKKAKNLTRYKKPVKESTLTEQAATFTQQTKIKDLKGGGPARGMKASGGQTPNNSEKGKGVSPETFANNMARVLTIKRAINKRLPAEIRRNMGKPALTNRTSRFSDSAIIEDMTPAAKTLMVKYTYRLNPYETFENTGNRKWPSGYNPKPLISKSIRNLALGMFKITNLTTRRV
jgi:hypothetical protein